MPLSVGHNHKTSEFFIFIFTYLGHTSGTNHTTLGYQQLVSVTLKTFHGLGLFSFSSFRNLFQHNSVTSLLRADSVTLQPLTKLHRADPQPLKFQDGLANFKKKEVSLCLMQQSVFILVKCSNKARGTYSGFSGVHLNHKHLQF